MAILPTGSRTDLMSSSAADRPELDIREQLVRIDRAIAETRKFQADIGNIQRDRLLQPFVVIFGCLAALGSTLGPAVMRAVWGAHG